MAALRAAWPSSEPPPGISSIFAETLFFACSLDVNRLPDLRRGTLGGFVSTLFQFPAIIPTGN